MDTGESDSYIVGKCGIQTHGPIHGSAYDRDPDFRSYKQWFPVTQVPDLGMYLLGKLVLVLLPFNHRGSQADSRSGPSRRPDGGKAKRPPIFQNPG